MRFELHLDDQQLEELVERVAQRVAAHLAQARDDELPISLNEAARRLGFAPETLRKHLASGLVRGVRVGRRWAIYPAELRRLEGRASAPPPRLGTSARPARPRAARGQRERPLGDLIDPRPSA